ncbi:helix-turn-helix transcriptional regulator [Streptomyces buecherae]|uniref:helix-turn-helix domain-containing protein n=1 Tax=Streptomyces buecherae TaxID=2763006 RepID=UPI0033FAA72E
MSAQPGRDKRQVRHLHGDGSPSAEKLMAGFALRTHREGMEVKLDRIARSLGCSISTLSRLENGRAAEKLDIERTLDAYQLTDALHRRHVVEMFAEAGARGWLRPYKTAASNHALAQASFESMAQRMRVSDLSSIPGLLQTREYARAVIRLSSRHKPADVERLVGLRMERQRRWFESKKMIICVLDEALLMRLYGSPKVMRDQLDHLVTLSQLPYVELHVAPRSRYDLPIWSSATIFDFPDKQVPDIVYVEELNTAFYITNEEEVDERVKTFDHLLRMSLRADLSQARIRDLRNHVPDRR